MRSYSLGSMETKKWFMFSGKMLERCGTGTRIGGKDAEEMEGAAQGRQMYSDGGLYWEARGAGDKIAKDYGRYGGIKFGSVSVYSVPASLQRCRLGRG